MSAIPIRIGDSYASSGHMEFQLQRISDLQYLPGLNKCAVGSIAWLQDYSKAWSLGEDNIWHEF